MSKLPSERIDNIIFEIGPRDDKGTITYELSLADRAIIQFLDEQAKENQPNKHQCTATQCLPKCTNRGQYYN